MLKYIFTVWLTVLSALFANGQNIVDSGIVSKSAVLMDLHFTAAEKDSMLDGLKDLHSIYVAMHKLDLSNNQPYPFRFNPAPAGMLVPTKQAAINWNIPSGIELPSNKNDLAFYSLLQLASLIKNRKISSVELTQFYLARLHKWADTLHCVISFTDELAMSQAREADSAIRTGHYRGPLHGIPYGLKDLFAVKGTKTTWGAAPFKNQQFNEDAFVYQQLRKAGAVLCAKLSLGALAMDDQWFGGLTRNPWNLQTGSSGSSAGSTAATVAGLVPFAIGTETWGSIVAPSHTCAATGLRPSFGSVARSGAMVLSWSLDKIGPICRSAEDAAIVFYYIKGTDGKDAGAIERAFNYSGKTNWASLRIAYAKNYFDTLSPSSPEWQAIKTFKNLGAKLMPVEFPDSTIYPIPIMSPIIAAECSAAFDAFTRSDKDNEMNGQNKGDWPNQFRTGSLIPAAEYLNANRHRYSLIEKMNTFMQQYDVVICPSFAGNQLAITNLTGQPVVCIPVGFTKEGMPTSLTLLGNLYQEATILSVAKAFQDATAFHRKHPALFQ